MAITPTAPPNRPRHGRRPPKGRHAVPLSPRDQKRRDNLHAASTVLRTTGDPKHAEYADDVDYVLSGQGAEFVKRLRLDEQGITYTQPDNMAVRIPRARWDVVDAGRKAGANLTEIVEDGFRRFLTGDLEILVEARTAPGTAGASKVINVRPNRELRDTVTARCERDRKQKTGPGKSVFPTTVAAHALYEHFQIGPYAPDPGK